MAKFFTKKDNLVKFQEWANTGDSSIREELIVGNMPLAKMVANQISRSYKMDKEELLQYAYEALIEAVDTYDVSLGSAFSTYAVPYIWNFLIDHFAQMFGISEKPFAYYYAKTRSISDLDLSSQEIVNAMIANHMISKKYMQRNINRVNLINAKQVDYINDDENHIASNLDVWTVVEYGEMKRILHTVWDKLLETEKNILILRYGLVDGQQRSQAQVGRLLHVTRSRINQIETKALNKLKKEFKRKKYTVQLEPEFLDKMQENLLENMHKEFASMQLDEYYYNFSECNYLDDCLGKEKIL